MPANDRRPATLKRKTSLRSGAGKEREREKRPMSPLSDAKSIETVRERNHIHSSKRRILIKLRTLLPLKIPHSHSHSHSQHDHQHGRQKNRHTPHLSLPHFPPKDLFTPTSVRLPSVQEEKEKEPPVRPNIKIRVVTWNMHDSLPTGDLSDLLGEIPEQFHEPFQQVPTPTSQRAASSGSTSDSVPPTPHSHASTSSSRGNRTNNSAPSPPEKENGIPLFPYDSNHPYHIVVIGGQECPSMPYHDLRGRKGWTDILEDWLSSGPTKPPERNHSQPFVASPVSQHSRLSSSGGGEAAPRSSFQEIRPVVREAAASIRSSLSVRSILQKRKERESEHREDEEDRESLRSFSSDRDPDGDSESSSSESESEEDSVRRRRRKTPYVLVAKERLMGIYLAVFVFHECRHLVQKISKSKVTSGLLGGRVGNKGSVGISVNFADSRLLFMSTHLAAHQGGVAIRKANVEKIKHELTNNDFQPGESTSKDITDRFDQVFFFGDLNFRLNISRLHADWLLKAKDYDNALKFDQLKEILNQQESCLKGFNEAPIKFPPTYKYDLLKLTRRKSYTKAGKKVKRGMDDGDNDDALSFLSSRTSMEDPDRPELPSPLPSSQQVPKLPPVTETDQSLAPVLQKAKLKFLTLVRSRSALQLASRAREQTNETNEIEIIVPDKGTLSIDPEAEGRLRLPSIRMAKSDIALPLTENTPKLKMVADAVFDSSSKQRVQSWTDRILFKTNVRSKEKSEEVEHGATTVAFTLSPFPTPSSIATSLAPTGSPSLTVSTPLSTSTVLSPSTPRPPVFSTTLETVSLEQSSGVKTPLTARPTAPSDLLGYPTESAVTPLTARPIPPPIQLGYGAPHETPKRSPHTPRKPNRSYTLPVPAQPPADPPGQPPPLNVRPSKTGLWARFKLHSQPPAPMQDAHAPATEPKILERTEQSTTMGTRHKRGRSHTITGTVTPTTASQNLTELEPQPVQITDSPPSLLPRTSSRNPGRKNTRIVSLDSGPTSPSIRSEAQAATLPNPSIARPGGFSLGNLRAFFMRRQHSINPVMEPGPEELKEPEPLGPKRGEIECLLYDSVADLRKMEAYSDHRPVIGVYLVGI
ncbi:DNase I-like protein [Atractiella rhizophila]|nr:DNase I-like protein [Atractiella rhizophila]